MAVPRRRPLPPRDEPNVTGWLGLAALVIGLGVAILAVLYAGQLEKRLRQQMAHDEALARDLQALSGKLVTVQELVSLGQGVSLVPQMARQMDNSPTRRYRSLAGEKPTRTIALVCRAMTVTPVG